MKNNTFKSKVVVEEVVKNGTMKGGTQYEAEKRKDIDLWEVVIWMQWSSAGT
jgi:hypothetical protein